MAEDVPGYPRVTSPTNPRNWMRVESRLKRHLYVPPSHLWVRTAYSRICNWHISDLKTLAINRAPKSARQRKRDKCNVNATNVTFVFVRRDSCGKVLTDVVHHTQTVYGLVLYDDSCWLVLSTSIAHVVVHNRKKPCVQVSSVRDVTSTCTQALSPQRETVNQKRKILAQHANSKHRVTYHLQVIFPNFPAFPVALISCCTEDVQIVLVHGKHCLLF